MDLRTRSVTPYVLLRARKRRKTSDESRNPLRESLHSLYSHPPRPEEIRPDPWVKFLLFDSESPNLIVPVSVWKTTSGTSKTIDVA